MSKTANEVLKKIRSFVDNNTQWVATIGGKHDFDAVKCSLLYDKIDSLMQPESAQWQVGDRLVRYGSIYKIIDIPDNGKFLIEPINTIIKNYEGQSVIKNNADGYENIDAIKSGGK